MLETIRRNFGYKVLSILIAVLLYYIANGQRNPQIFREVFVQPEVVSLPEGLAVKSPPRGTTVTVTGLTSAVNSLRPQSIRATADGTRARAGYNRLPVTYVFPLGVRAEEIGTNASYAEVTLEEKKKVPFAVDVLFNSPPPPGYEYGEEISQPRTVQVSGTADEVLRVARVVARVERRGDEQDIVRTVALVAETEDKRIVEGVEVKPTQVQVRIPLRRLPVTKNMLLSARFEGDAAPGYMVRSYTFTPSEVTVIGSPEQLAEWSSIVVPINVAGLERSEDRSVSVKPPTGLRLRTPIVARVHLEVAPISTPGEGSATPAPQPTDRPSVPAATPTPSPTPEPSGRPTNPPPVPPATPEPAPTPSTNEALSRPGQNNNPAADELSQN